MVVLPVPLTPTTSTTPGLPSRRSTCEPAVQARVDQGEQLLAQDVVRAAAPAPPSTRSRVRSRSTSSWVGRDADVGGDQGVLDLLPGVLVEPVAGQQGEQAAAQAALRAGEPLAQPDQPAGRALGRSRVGAGGRRRRAGRRPRRCASGVPGVSASSAEARLPSGPPGRRRGVRAAAATREVDQADDDRRRARTAMPMIR